jgi:hypothetical protein
MSNFISPNFINNLFLNAFKGFLYGQAGGNVTMNVFYTSDNEIFYTSTNKQFMVKEE